MSQNEQKDSNDESKQTFLNKHAGWLLIIGLVGSIVLLVVIDSFTSK